MKLINLQITNLKKIKAAFFQFGTKGGVTQIVGGNEQAKSTVLNAIMVLLFGPSLLEKGSTTKGEDRTELVGELDNGYSIKRVFTEKTDRIELSRIIDGKMYPESSPQKFLDGITNQIAIRPIAFLNEPPAKKSAIIAGCLGINDKLVEFATKIKEYEESRAEIGRNIKAYGKLDEWNPELTIDKFKSVKDIQKEIDEASDYNANIIQEYQDKLNQWEKHKLEFERKQGQKEFIRLKIDSIKDDLMKQYDTIVNIVPESAILLSKIVQDIQDHLQVQKNAYVSLSYMVEAPKPVDESELKDLVTIKAKMETLIDDNSKIQKNIELKEAIDKLANEQEKYTKTALYIEKLKNDREDVISEAAKTAKFPYAVDIVDGNIEIDGIGSENWSTAQGLLFALEACKLLNPQLKVVCIDDAEHFDPANLIRVQKWAEENDYQTIITIVKREEEFGDENVYVIEAGEIINTPMIPYSMESQVSKKEEKVEKTKKVSKIIEDIPEVKKKEESTLEPPIVNEEEDW